MKKDALTVKELAAELRMSLKSVQRACVVVSEKRANCGTSETWGMVYLVCVVEGEKRRTRGTGERRGMVYLVHRPDERNKQTR